MRRKSETVRAATSQSRITRGVVMAVAYLDIETNYLGTFSPTEDRFSRGAKHHLITVLGIRLVDEKNDNFLQLVYRSITREEVLRILDGATRLVTYNGRSIPDSVKGRVGFDPVIEAQLGLCLDRDFDHTDRVPLCWQRGLYGGQKKVEALLGLKRTLSGRYGASTPSAERSNFWRHCCYIIERMNSCCANWKSSSRKGESMAGRESYS
jgi:hypothetical protein